MGKADKPMAAFSYITDPDAIYRESFARVSKAAKLDHFPDDLVGLVIRLIHACGMVDLADDLAFSGQLVSRATASLQSGKPIFCDCEMVASGITKRFLPAENLLIVTLNDAKTPALAKELKTTRSAAAVDLWDDRLEGAVVAIGNAPTALFRLLERIAAGGPSPAAILGFPVGFVGAAESKQALADSRCSAEFITIHGTRGGSAIAAAAVNALSLAAQSGSKAGPKPRPQAS